MNHNFTILIVDDIAENRFTLKSLLVEEFTDLTVLQAASGQEALGTVLDCKVDLIILDIQMPGMDGFEVAELLKANKETRDIPVIFLTAAFKAEKFVDRGVRIGAVDYLTKPIDEHQLLNKLRLYRKVFERELELANLLAKQQEYQLHLEEEIQKRKAFEKLILRAKQEWERTVDAMPDLIALLNNEHEIVRLNIPMAKALGMDRQEAIGRSIFSGLHLPDYCPVGTVAPDDLSNYIERYDEQLGGHFEIRVIPNYGADGRPSGSVYMARNITARKEAEKEKKQLQAQLLQGQKLEAVGRLAAGIAHEINTPIQYVGTNVEFLEDAFSEISDLMANYDALLAGATDKELLPELIEAACQSREELDWDYLVEEIPTAISQSRDGVQRVSTIVRAMKEFSHPGSKKKQPQDLNRIISNTITVAGSAWQYVAELETDFDQGMPPLNCFSDELGQVFLNLLSNAAQAISSNLGDPPNGKGTIRISTCQDGECVEIRVSDNGGGIPEASRDMIFDPFYTTKEVGKGTGQGLTICHGVVVEKHGGSLSFETETGQGTTFIVRLPFVEK